MERFAKRKVKLLPSRSGNTLAFFIEDSGTKHFIGEFSKHCSKEFIMLDVKNWWNEHKLNDGGNDEISDH